MRPSARKEPTRVKLPNAAISSAPLVIDGPISLVVVLTPTMSPIAVVHRVLLARTLHSVISELHERSTLRFVLNDSFEPAIASTWSRGAAERLERAPERWRAALSRCEQLAGDAPDFSLSFTAIRAELEARAEQLRSHPFVETIEINDNATDLVARTRIDNERWRPRELDAPRPFASPTALPPRQGMLSDLARCTRDGLRVQSALIEPALAQAALGDGLPIVLMGLEITGNALVAAACADLLELPQALGFFEPGMMVAPWSEVDEFLRIANAEEPVAAPEEAAIRHSLLCNAPWKPRLRWNDGGEFVSEHAERCRQRVFRTLRARDEARAFLQGARGTETIRDAVRDELEERYLAFVCALRTGFDLEVASQSVVRVCKTLNRVVREADVAGARAALAMLESMASIVGIL